jgi:hypothetical protein
MSDSATETDAVANIGQKATGRIFGGLPQDSYGEIEIEMKSPTIAAARNKYARRIIA